MSTTPSKARYIMIGGFLGAGKTTAMGKLAQHLTAQGLKVGLITNDQAGGLVDTRLLRSQGFATEEIAGGCFCCRFNSLVEAADKLSNNDNDTTRPDIFLAEPVGSCTDLVATVTYPLRRMYGDNFTIAPLSVLVDPTRARRIFNLDPTPGNFSHKVVYIFKKQLEEADLILINKSETLPAEDIATLQQTLAAEYPHATVLSASTRLEQNLTPWFDLLTNTEQTARQIMAVDYDTYADGEALLGWLNATVSISSNDEFEAEAFLKVLANEIQTRLNTLTAEIAHFKMTFSPSDSLNGELASIHLVRSDLKPEIGLELDEPVTQGYLIINLRAETDPDALSEAVQSALAVTTASFPTLVATIDHQEHFRPGRPTPTHRDTNQLA